jgi:hypothetical protein
MKPPYDSDFDNLIAWICGDENPPATATPDFVEADNGQSFSRCDNGEIWDEEAEIIISLTEAKKLIGARL